MLLHARGEPFFVKKGSPLGGVIVDVIRVMRIAVEKSVSGPLVDICAYYFKYPPVQYSDEEAYREIEKFIE